MPGAQVACPAQRLEAARDSQAAFEVLVVPLDPLLDPLARLVPRSGEDVR